MISVRSIKYGNFVCLEALMRRIAKGEPLRVRLYALTAVVLGYLGYKSVLTPADVEFYLSTAGLVFAVESSRRRVTPVAPAAPKQKTERPSVFGWVETKDDLEEEQ